MGLTVANNAERLLAYSAAQPGDTMPVGMLTALVDSIMGALGELREAAPGMFTFPKGGVLAAPATLSVSVSFADPTALTLGSPGVVPGDLCTVRLAGGSVDSTIRDVTSNTGTISPGYEAVTSGTVTVTADVWHDAWQVADGGASVSDVGTVVRVGGVVLDPVQGRWQAESRMGQANACSGRRVVTNANGKPCVWWLERYKEKTFVVVYPMPGARMPIEAQVVRGFTDLTTANVLTSTETYDLPEDVAREVWRPLAAQRFCATPFFTLTSAKDEVARQAAKAMEWIELRKPKKPRLPDWLESRRAQPGFGRRGW